MMKRLVIGRHVQRIVLVDDEDYAVVSKYTWHFSTCKGVIRRPYIGEKKACLFLHRMILGVGPSIRVKHINGNRLDCRKSNLLILGGKNVVASNLKPRC